MLWLWAVVGNHTLVQGLPPAQSRSSLFIHPLPITACHSAVSIARSFWLGGASGNMVSVPLNTTTPRTGDALARKTLVAVGVGGATVGLIALATRPR